MSRATIRSAFAIVVTIACGVEAQQRRNVPAAFPIEFRSLDGIGNNRQNPSWGAAGTSYLRTVPSDYGDGRSLPAGANRTSARRISNVVSCQMASSPNAVDASDFVWQWGQFLDHDIDATPTASPAIAFDIPVPPGDPWFDPKRQGNVVIGFNRSAHGVVGGVWEQVNDVTAFIDGSNVYGSDAVRAAALRSNDGSGRLLTSSGDNLPYNTRGLPNEPSNAPTFFLAGDVRANEQVGLTAMHTIFVREHNFWADRIRAAAPSWSGDRIYEFARAAVVAELQAITMREFLPVLLGPNAIPPYHGYRDRVSPAIANEFAAAAYRVGHTMLPSKLLRLKSDLSPHPLGALELAGAFFSPSTFMQTGADPILRGLAKQRAEAIDPYIVDGVRNFLFGAPGAGGFDLAALNIQRGRDHGLPSYAVLRRRAGGAPARRFADVTPDPIVQAKLASVYASPEDIDAWVGLLAEPAVRGGMVGRTLRAMLRDQFVRLRDGDRFWYEGYLPRAIVTFVNTQTLATIVRRNTSIGSELQDSVFRVR